MVRDFGKLMRCKERSAGIAIVTKSIAYTVNRSFFFLNYFYGTKRMKNKKTPIRNKTQRTSGT